MANLSANDCGGRSPQMSVEVGENERNARKAEANFADVLAELHGLLEQYAPQWYTQQQHVRVERALRILGKL